MKMQDIKNSRRQKIVWQNPFVCSFHWPKLLENIYVLYEKIDAIFKFASVLIFRLRLFDVVYRYFMCVIYINVYK